MPGRITREADHPVIRTSVTGEVSYPEVDPITRTFRITIAVPGDHGRVQPCLLARIKIDRSRQAR